MKKALILSILATFSFASCQKNAAEPACEINNTGTLIIDSHQSEPFNIYLDGAYLGRVEAHSEQSFTVSVQTYALTARRSDGSGSTWSLSVTVRQCQPYTGRLY